MRAIPQALGIRGEQLQCPEKKKETTAVLTTRNRTGQAWKTTAFDYRNCAEKPPQSRGEGTTIHRSKEAFRAEI